MAYNLNLLKRSDVLFPLSSTDHDNNLDKIQTGIDAVDNARITHEADQTNPHAVTSVQVGLGNVDNTSDADKPVSTAQQTALDLKEDAINKGVANGYASLDSSGLVPSAQLPSYVDDVIEVATYASLPVTGETSKIYIVVADETSGGDTSTYRWTGSVYAMVSNSLTAADIKSLYESNGDTNAFTDNDAAMSLSLQSGAIGRITQPLSSLDLQNGFEFKGTGSVTFDQPSDLNYIDRYGNWKTAPADGTGAFGENGLVNAVGSTNLVTYSEDFQEWVQSGATTYANVDTAPDGSFTADAIEGIDQTDVVQYVYSVTDSGQTFTSSVFAKEGTSGYVNLRLVAIGGTTQDQSHYFEFSTESFTRNDTGTAKVEKLKNGWYRISAALTLNNTGQTNTQLRLGGSISGFSGNVIAWGAQLEESTFPTPYIPSDVTFTSRGTTGTYYDATGTLQTADIDVARMSYNPANLTAPPKLLVEEERTNLLPNSSDLENNTYWTGTATITPNAVAAPDGTITADKVEDIDNASTEYRYSDDAAISSGTTTYTMSAHLKKGTSQYCQLEFRVTGGTTAVSHTVYFDFDNEVITGDSSGVAKVEPLANGWFRISTQVTDNDSGNVFARVLIRPATLSTSLDVTLTGYTYAWGFQVEEGYYPTSYIPTTTAAATRLADVTTSASATRLSMNLYYPAYGNVPDLTNGATYLVEFVPEFTATGAVRYVMNTYTDSASSFGLYFNSAGDLVVRYVQSSVVESGISTIPDLSGQVMKVALRYTSGQIETFLQGSKIGTKAVSTNLPVIDDTTAVNLGAVRTDVTSSRLPAQFISDKWYPRALTDEEILLVHGG
jgi:hypothetical protein